MENVNTEQQIKQIFFLQFIQLVYYSRRLFVELYYKV